MAGNQGEVDSKRKPGKRERRRRIASVYDEFAASRGVLQSQGQVFIAANDFAAERFAGIARKNAYRHGFLARAHSLDLESLHREIWPGEEA